MYFGANYGHQQRQGGYVKFLIILSHQSSGILAQSWIDWLKVRKTRKHDLDNLVQSRYDREQFL